jgi:antitoxin component YwqK of YwqJK toxin-antitoxin module
MKKQILIEKYIEPSEILEDITGSIVKRWLDKNGDLHSFMGQPAFIYYKDGQIITQEWHKKGVIHRDGDLPAIIEYNNSGKVIEKYYYKKGEFHRDGDLPAYIKYDNNGKVTCQEYYRNGKLIEYAELNRVYFFKIKKTKIIKK